MTERTRGHNVPRRVLSEPSTGRSAARSPSATREVRSHQVFLAPTRTTPSTRRVTQGRSFGLLERTKAFVLSDTGSDVEGGQGFVQSLDSLLVGVGLSVMILGGILCFCSRRRTDYRYSRELQAGGSAVEVRLATSHAASSAL